MNILEIIKDDSKYSIYTNFGDMQDEFYDFLCDFIGNVFQDNDVDIDESYHCDNLLLMGFNVILSYNNNLYVGILHNILGDSLSSVNFKKIDLNFIFAEMAKW